MKTVIYQEDFEYPETQMHFHLYCQDYPELHDHDYWEFFFVIQGSVTHCTEKGQQVLTEGMGYLIHPKDRHCFTDASDDYIQCYTERFAEGESLAGFRSPHNSPNNIVHLKNVWPELLRKYFPKLL